jgi:hypothetical protein
LAYNSAKHSTTGKAPFELERGYLPLTPRSLLAATSADFHINPSSESYGRLIQLARHRAQQCIDEAFDYSKARWDASHLKPNFKIGDHILISTSHFGFGGPRKLHEHFIGPFTVIRLIGDNALEVNLTGDFSRKHPVFPVSLCKKFDAGEVARFPGRPELPPPQPEIIDEQPQYHVDRILDEQIRKTPKGRRR